MTVTLGDPALTRAIAASFLGSLSPDVRAAVVRRGRIVSVPADTVHVRPDGGVARGGLVVDGIFRVFVMAADGRRLTVRHVRAGALAGLVSGVGQPAPVFVGAVTDGRLLELTADDLHELATEYPTLGWALAREISLRLRETIESLAEASFGSLRERLVRLLFEVATPTDDGRLLAHTTQQQLADSLGTVREVIARLLGPLREVGLIDVARGAIVILDRDALRALGGHWYQSRYWIAGLPRDPDST